MSSRWPEIGSTVELLRTQDADLALVHELMRERARLEQEFVDGLRALVEKHKPHSKEESREYSNVLLSAFEQEIEARSDLNPNLAEHASLGAKELSLGSQLAQALLAAQMTHEGKYTSLLASRDELTDWFERRPSSPWDVRMPLAELEYRLSVHEQRKCASSLNEWYRTKLLLMIESHHSALENTKAIMATRINDIIKRAWTCNQIYSNASSSADNLSPSNHRILVEASKDLESASQALVPVPYYNWFFDGEPSPLHFGIGILPLDSSRVPVYWETSRHSVQLAEQRDILNTLYPSDVNLFELAQYCPLLPLNSREFERLNSAGLVSKQVTRRLKPDIGNISRRDLSALLVPDEPVWEPLGSARRKELLRMAIGKIDPWWLTFRRDSEKIVEAVLRKWDFDTDKPKSREK
ncbi:hypothetical protein PIIN_02734 [Serendipita indica DSM 11827]|uniref:Uncharacterized protein n=1 Tax=Serendipita indica (strain DSM 11827) TaxID=1109443 RepID=G4TC31_SERID|nr:hypothetical protein PIIN_02734 [Serendipita indica DSM 11827]